MSHIATNWAFAQRGLKPAEKLLLLCLADRHNPDLGCFPRQDTLARDAGMSRASVNDNLARLEERGLIRRQQRMDPRTRRQMATRYILGFEDDLPQGPCPESGHGFGGLHAVPELEQVAQPCPESGHGAVSRSGEPCPDFASTRVQNLDTNPVREPLDDDEERAGARALFVSRIREEGGIRLDGLEAIGVALERWRGLGLSDAQILDTVRAVAARCPGAVSRAAYFDREMSMLAKEARRAAQSMDAPSATARKAPARSRGRTDWQALRARAIEESQERVWQRAHEMLAQRAARPSPSAPSPRPAAPRDHDLPRAHPTAEERARMRALVAQAFPASVARAHSGGEVRHG